MSNHDFAQGRNRRLDDAIAPSPAGEKANGQGPQEEEEEFAEAGGRDRDSRGGGPGGGIRVPATRRPEAHHFAEAGQGSPEPYGRDLFGPRSATHDEDAAPDYRKYLGILLKNRWLIAGVTAISLGLGLSYTLLQAPVYRASATIQIQREVANISGVAGLEPVEAGRGAEFYQTQYQLLNSRALAERVVAKLGLATNQAFLEGRPSGWDRLYDLVFADGQAGKPSLAERQSMAVELVQRGLGVEPVRSSSIVRISYGSNHPHIAQQVANAIAENFITSNLERNLEASAYARRFLEERLQELRLKLEESERALVEYAGKQDILPTGSEQSLSTSNLTDANSALAESGKERLRHEMRWRQAEAMKGGGLPQGLESEAIEKLRERRSELVLEYEEKLKVYKPGFPDMVRLRTRIEEIDRHIEAEVDRIRESLRLQYEASVREEQSLLQHLAELKSEVMDYQNRNIQYTILRREVDTNRSLYEGLLQRYKEIGVAGGIDSNTAVSNVSFVDRAEVPGAPYTPRLSWNLAGALIFGLALGGSAAFIRELFDGAFHMPEELEEGLGLPLLGIIPLSDEVSDLGRFFQVQRSPPAEAYRSLRTTLQFSTPAGAPRTLVVTSALPGEGKSTTAVNLAGQFATLGLRVLLIDADLRQPSLHRLLGCDGSLGLTNYLVAGSTPSGALQATALPNLTLLPGGPLPPNPGELLAGARMASLLAVAVEQFDLVIIDTPPVAGLADAPLLASMSLGTLLVVEANRTHRKAVAAGLKRLLFARAEVVGAVFNKFDARQASFGDGHGYFYGDESYYGHGAQKRLTGLKDD